MEPQGSLPRLQKLNIGLYLQPNESITQDELARGGFRLVG